MEQNKGKRRLFRTIFSTFLILSWLLSPVLAASEKTVVLGGELFGVDLSLNGVLVTEFAPFSSGDATVSPARDAGLKEGDLIVRANGEEVNDPATLSRLVEEGSSGGITLSVLRAGGELSLTVTPQKSAEDGHLHLGVWVRSNLSGVGTVTFYETEKNSFGGLGHGVCAEMSDTVLGIRDGVVYTAALGGIVRGKSGSPGQLRASFSAESVGKALKNTECGVFGTWKGPRPDERRVMIAGREHVTVGEAEVVCTVSAEGRQIYKAEIVQIFREDKETKNFLLKVTDERLLSATGGIVQGMSGSPILQNGKLVGAVTHVLVNDPTCGYGIFIENMLDAAQSVADQQKLKEAS